MAESGLKQELLGKQSHNICFHRKIDWLTLGLVADFAVDFVIDFRESLPAVQLQAHLVVQGVVEHVVELFAAEVGICIQHLEAGTDRCTL